MPAGLLAKLYRVFVLPILDYCDVVWTPTPVQNFKRLERIHSKFNCIPSSTDFLTCVTLTERCRFHAAIQVFRVLHKFSPPYLSNVFQYAADVTLRTGRNCYRLFVPRVRTTIARHSFYYRGVQIWNSLNPALYAARRLDRFKFLYQSLYRYYVYIYIYIYIYIYSFRN